MQQDLAGYFNQLSQLLTRYRPYWQLLPFQHQELPWAGQAWQADLALLTPAELDHAEQTAQLPPWLASHFAELFQLEPPLAASQAAELSTLPFWLQTGISGRKLEQIDALCQQWLPATLPVLEWCAGKGHLGRILAQRFGQPVTSVEWQPQLCAEGAALAEKHQLEQQFICADVLSEPLNGVLNPAQHLVALHACGDLHIRLLRQAVQYGCRQLQLVPCCYHLIAAEQYQPLSALAQQHNLMLDKDDLKLVVQGQVTGGARVNRLRHTEVLWRLAYDELRADISKERTYQPLSSVAKHWFSGDFATFARWAAAQHQLPLPANMDWSAYLARAAKRQLLVRRIELVRHLFRRPLELWLALDKALYLQQHGYNVRLTQLCQREITPRNILLSASKA
ncbi:methyltransferase [Rheinheimera fenheensis]|uniref:methyltransferase n=1 Tax=Rheinheimera fenheensis TaxID=3152295 RepID=UPI00325E1EA0